MISTLLQLGKDTIKNYVSSNKINLVIETQSWSIQEDANNIIKNWQTSQITPPRKTFFSCGLKNKITHFMSTYTLVDEQGIKIDRFPHNFLFNNNKIILTWFHVVDNDEKNKFIPELSKKIDYLHTACTNTKNKLINLGMDENKIKIITLGIDLKKFRPVNQQKKLALRKQLNLPLDKIIIGSFQKDGNGWGQGLNPKLIKGPDIFCDVVEALAKKYNIHILLTGPARGYIKKKLEKANIKYSHHYLKNFHEIVKYYQALDLYVVTSREEGGPKALLESLASGIPLVTTKVGMVSDMLTNRHDAIITETEDTQSLIKNSLEILENDKLKEQLISNGLKTIKNYDQQKIAKNYYEKLYKPLLKNL